MMCITGSSLNLSEQRTGSCAWHLAATRVVWRAGTLAPCEHRLRRRRWLHWELELHYQLKIKEYGARSKELEMSNEEYWLRNFQSNIEVCLSPAAKNLGAIDTFCKTACFLNFDSFSKNACRCMLEIGTNMHFYMHMDAHASKMHPAFPF